MSCSPNSNMLLTMEDTKGFSPPPLSMNPQTTKGSNMPGVACIQPKRRPGARILENDPSENTLSAESK